MSTAASAGAGRATGTRAHLVCLAPMMERTDRHFRYLLRLIAPRTFLYTEMITAAAIERGDAAALLRFDPAEHPVAVQLGGSSPESLAAAAARAEAAGYDEVNLNVGCPSDRVQAGCFGAALMLEPALVGECVAAIRDRVRIPVTVKTRLGVDHHDSYEFLTTLVDSITAAGCRTLMVHARKAWLKGLSPRQNREIPPLDYARVHRLKADYPGLEIVLNGGLKSVADVLEHIGGLDGVMLGRTAYDQPLVIGEIECALYGNGAAPALNGVITAYLQYIERELRSGTPLKRMSRHLLGINAGQPGARSWRRDLGMLDEGAAGYAGLCRLAARVLGNIADADAASSTTAANTAKAASAANAADTAEVPLRTAPDNRYNVRPSTR